MSIIFRRQSPKTKPTIPSQKSPEHISKTLSSTWKLQKSPKKHTIFATLLTNRKLSAIRMTNSSVQEMFENTLKKYWAFNGAEN